jgi:hypothetical protein
MAREWSLRQRSVHTRLAHSSDWILLLVAAVAPPVGWNTLAAEYLFGYMQCVLFLLYGLHGWRLWSHKHTLKIEKPARGGLAAEAARIYFEHMRVLYLRSGVKLLMYVFAVNLLIVIIRPDTATGMLWLLMASVVCFSLVSTRMVLCHRSVEHGSFGTDELDIHELAEFLLRHHLHDRPPPRRCDLRLQMDPKQQIGVGVPDATVGRA